MGQIDTKLEAQDVRVYFGGVKAVDDVSVSLAGGEIVGLIGPNGAGKTTLVNALTGFAPLTSGTVTVGAQNVSGWPADRLARKAGVVRTFQSARVFNRMSARQNVEVAALGIGRRRREAVRIADGLLARLKLEHRAETLAEALAYGEQRLVTIARALAANPSFLMLDEPAAGLSEVETEALMHSIANIRGDYGCGILLIEHDMALVMRLTDRIYVLDHGKQLAEGLPNEIRRNPAVIAAYLGSSGDAAEVPHA